MEFTSFVDHVKDRIKDFLPEKYANAEIMVYEQTKINSEYTGLLVRSENSEVNPTVNLNKFHEEYEKGLPIEDVLHSMAKLIQRDGPEVDVNKLREYDSIKDSLFIRVCNSIENEDYLKRVPHVMIEDIAITYHVDVARNKEGVASMPITNDQLERYGISKEQLHKDALVSSPKVNEPEIVNLQELITRIFLEQFEDGLEEGSMGMFAVPQSEVPMTVVTNKDGMYGAATMFYPDMMDHIGEMMKGNYFILPSSTHETIVIPDDGDMDYKKLLSMVTEINATEVDKEDKLTDQVYHYDVVDKVFEKASSYEDRTKDRSNDRKSVLQKLAENKDVVRTAGESKKMPCQDQVSL